MADLPLIPNVHQYAIEALRFCLAAVTFIEGQGLIVAISVARIALKVFNPEIMARYDPHRSGFAFAMSSLWFGQKKVFGCQRHLSKS